MKFIIINNTNLTPTVSGYESILRQKAPSWCIVTFTI